MLGWCAEAGAAAIPYGGGTSVVGGVEPRIGDDYAGAVSDGPRRARPGARGRPGLARGADPGRRAGPGARGAARASTGSPCATSRSRSSTRPSAAGSRPAPAATSRPLYTHIDDLVESVRAITPRGVWESRRLPGSGAGPSPDRMLIGSEGILGVITEAWVRVQAAARAQGVSAGVAFDASPPAPRRCASSRSRASTRPTAACSTPREAGITSAGDDGRALLVLGFESAHQPVDALAATWRSSWRATTAARSPPSDERRTRRRGAEGDAVGAWRHAFLAAPYLRDTFVACGVLSDTFETAITWDRFDGLPRDGDRGRAAAVARGAAPEARVDAAASPTSIPTARRPTSPSCAPARRGAEVAQWDEIKAAASEAVIDARGDDHPPPRGRPRPPALVRPPAPGAVCGGACGRAKRAVDPGAGILNRGGS